MALWPSPRLPTRGTGRGDGGKPRLQEGDFLSVSSIYLYV